MEELAFKCEPQINLTMTTKTKKTGKRIPKFDYKSIKTFEDACKKLNVDPLKLPDVSSILEEFETSIVAAYKLMIIYKAINDGWKPYWNNYDQYKYYPWFRILSSGFGFSGSCYDCGHASTAVGSRLCTDTREKAMYIAKQFEAEYVEYFLYS
jgi:hypothetical protein